jgi:hypothetical protein
MPRECRWELSKALVDVVGTRSVPGDVGSPVTYDFSTLCSGLATLTAWERWGLERDEVLKALLGIKETADAEIE